MRPTDRQWAGLLLFAGGVEFTIGILVAEVAYPGFSVSHDFLGDLGIGPTALLFNTATIAFGLALLGAAWFLGRALPNRSLAIAVALTGVGAIGFGMVPAVEPHVEPYLMIHNAVALLAFLAGASSAILTVRILRSPVRYVSAALGIVSIVALGFSVLEIYLGLDRGGMEQMIVWPILFWTVIAGTSLWTRRSAAPERSALAGPSSAETDPK